MPIDEPSGTRKQRSSDRYRVTSESGGPREVRLEVLAAHITAVHIDVAVNEKVANDKTLRSYCREGEAGYDVLMRRPTGDTL